MALAKPFLRRHAGFLFRLRLPHPQDVVDVSTPIVVIPVPAGQTMITALSEATTTSSCVGLRRRKGSCMHRHAEFGAEGTVQVANAGEEVEVAEVLRRFMHS